VSLGASLSRLPELAEALRAAAAGEIHAPAPRDKAAPPTGAIGQAGSDGAEGDLARLDGDLGADIAEAVAQTLRDDAPATTKDGGVVRSGFSAELDELTAIAAGGRQGLADIETRERERTGIASLKVRYNSVFGYYIEVTRSQLERVPTDYVRKQTVANAERFVTPELADYEAKILSADERRIALETEIFTALRERVGRDAPRLLGIGARVATVDVLAALAEAAHRNGYCRPVVDDGTVLDISDGRHPVVERFVAQPAGDWAAPTAAGAGGFVPNDVLLDPESEQILIVTGPNMAGKSTLIRQVALTVVLAQMGGFVPARAARIGLCDRVFTRVGAGDNLARGESTFLVEMKETAHILRYAGPRSLVILDEIGRGTSTYDGVSIAWAVAEHLHDVVGARTLFATHYHELCALADTHPRVRNVSVGAREWQGQVVFLRKLIAGGTSRSFGIDVAKLAGLPAPVIERARRILTSLEAGASARPPGDATEAGPRAALPGDPGGAQLGLFGAPVAAGVPVDAALNEVAETLRALDPDAVTPRQALDMLVELKKKLT
jgi:DNA mismatch repair protein MutS